MHSKYFQWDEDIVIALGFKAYTSFIGSHAGSDDVCVRNVHLWPEEGRKEP